MDLGTIITIIITVIGWAVMFGICKNKIDNNEKSISELKEDVQRDIDDIKNRQTQTDTILQSINTTLASLDAKVDLLIHGKIKNEMQ